MKSNPVIKQWIEKRKKKSICWLQHSFSDQAQEDEMVDGKILQYCSIDKREKKSIGEMEQEFLQALQVSSNN